MDGWKGPLSKSYRSRPGGRPDGPPAAQPFWTAQATGTNVSLTWPASEGTWSIVVMNADASAGVAADLALGVKVNFLGWVALGLFIAGGLLVLAGVLAMFFGFRSSGTGALDGTAAGDGLGRSARIGNGRQVGLPRACLPRAHRG